MKIYVMTDIGDSEASTPTANPSVARRILSYLRRRTNHAASDDMIADHMKNSYGIEKGEVQHAIGQLSQVKAIRSIG